MTPERQQRLTGGKRKSSFLTTKLHANPTLVREPHPETALSLCGQMFLYMYQSWIAKKVSSL